MRVESSVVYPAQVFRYISGTAGYNQSIKIVAFIIESLPLEESTAKRQLPFASSQCKKNSRAFWRRHYLFVGDARRRGTVCRCFLPTSSILCPSSVLLQLLYCSANRDTTDNRPCRCMRCSGGCRAQQGRCSLNPYTFWNYTIFSWMGLYFSCACIVQAGIVFILPLLISSNAGLAPGWWHVPFCFTSLGADGSSGDSITAGRAWQFWPSFRFMMLMVKGRYASSLSSAHGPERRIQYRSEITTRPRDLLKVR